MGSMSNVLVAGPSGFLYTTVAARLSEAGHQVIRLASNTASYMARRQVTDDLSDHGHHLAFNFILVPR